MEYDVSARNCLFNTEQNKIFKGYYSYSDCIMYCRIRDILRLCKCIPFFYPRLDDIGELAKILVVYNIYKWILYA